MCESLGLFILSVGLMIVVMYGLSFLVSLFDSLDSGKKSSTAGESEPVRLAARQRLATTRAVLDELRKEGRLSDEVHAQIDDVLVRELHRLPDAKEATWLDVSTSAHSVERVSAPIREAKPAAMSPVDFPIRALEVTEVEETPEQRAKNRRRALIEAERKAAGRVPAVDVG